MRKQQFTDVGSARGAPMGRPSRPVCTITPRSVALFAVHMVDYAYDDGGAYWGMGRPLYCARDTDGAEQFTRAGSRAEAAEIMGIPREALKRPTPAVRAARAIVRNSAPNAVTAKT